MHAARHRCKTWCKPGVNKNICSPDARRAGSSSSPECKLGPLSDLTQTHSPHIPFILDFIILVHASFPVKASL